MAVANSAALGPMALRFARTVIKRGIDVVKQRLPQRGAYELEPAFARNTHRLHPIARIRQQSSKRWYTSASAHIRTAIRADHWDSHAVLKGNRQACSSSSIIQATVGRSSPFAHTLRPQCAGALPRSASGYSLGGRNVRYFSHGPAASAQVVSQVSHAVRCFITQSKDSFDGYCGPNQSPGIRAVLAARLAEGNAPGAYIDFRIRPVFTCLTRGRNSSTKPSLGTTGFLDTLTADFSALMSDVSYVLQDLRKLADLGDLPVSLVKDNSTVRVHFRGTDTGFVGRLCKELSLHRAEVFEDETFAANLLAPNLRNTLADDVSTFIVAAQDSFCSVDIDSSYPSLDMIGDEQNAIHLANEVSSLYKSDVRSTLDEPHYFDEYLDNVRLISGSSDLASSGSEDDVKPHHQSVGNYEGLEGIQKFLSEIDEEYRRRVVPRDVQSRHE